MNQLQNPTVERVLIADRQASLLQQRPTAPGVVRVATGAALIRIGEWLRGRNEAAATPATDATFRLRTAA